jgi:glycosyltransferase involved in cell wall biosynthesis
VTDEMRVALVLASSTGGVGRHVMSLTAALVKTDVDVTVLGPAATDTQFGFAALGASFVPVEIPASPQPADAVAVRVLRRALATVDPEVIHAHGLRAGLVAALARPKTAGLSPRGATRRVPLVVTWHNRVLAGGLRKAIYSQLERYVAGAADVTLGASSDLVERVKALGGRDVRLGEVAAPTLPAPVRPPGEVRSEFGVGAGRPLVLSVGRLHPQKRHDLLIDVAARWTGRLGHPALDPVPEVVIAGSGPEYVPLAERILTSHAPVTLAGHREDVPDLLGAADLAVVTSDWEARQLFAQEALRAGVPLVSTAVGGLPELVGDAASFVPPNDPDAFDAAVRTLLGDRAARAELARRGLARAATWPTEAETAARVAAVYAELTAVGAP